MQALFITLPGVIVPTHVVTLLSSFDSLIVETLDLLDMSRISKVVIDHLTTYNEDGSCEPDLDVQVVACGVPTPQKEELEALLKHHGIVCHINTPSLPLSFGDELAVWAREHREEMLAWFSRHHGQEVSDDIPF